MSADEANGAADARFAAALREALTGATVVDALAAPAPPDRLLDLVVRAAAAAIPSPEGALFLIDREARVLTFDIVIGQTAATTKGLTVPLGRGIAGLVAVSGQPLAIADAQQDPRHARDVAEKSGYLPTTILAVPVVGADGVSVGVLELLDRQGQPTYSLADMELLGRFAELAALALEQRRAQAARAALLGQALAALGGLSPEATRELADRTDAFAARAAADPAGRRALDLAGLVATIGYADEAAHRTCVAVLEAFAAYVRERPAGGLSLDALR